MSALRHSRLINSFTLQKVADHVFRSSGRPCCHCEVVPLQFVFGPEQSLEKFREVWLSRGQLLYFLVMWEIRCYLCFFLVGSVISCSRTPGDLGASLL